MPIGPARMSLMEHLGELRMRLVRIVVVLLVSCLIFYLATPTIAQFMLMPVAQYLPANEDGQVLLNVFGAFDAFGLRFQIAFWASLVATAPFILWQILAFFLPALKPKERKWFVPTFIAGVGLFILGTIFCYLIILPPAFEWLTDQASVRDHHARGKQVGRYHHQVRDRLRLRLRAAPDRVLFGHVQYHLLR